MQGSFRRGERPLAAVVAVIRSDPIFPCIPRFFYIRHCDKWIRNRTKAETGLIRRRHSEPDRPVPDGKTAAEPERWAPLPFVLVLRTLV